MLNRTNSVCTNTCAALIAGALAALATVASAETVVFSDNFDTENGGVPTTNYDGFAQWTVDSGTVDLIGDAGNGSLADGYPDNGLYVDLDGSSNSEGHLVQSAMLTLEPGTYVLSFDLGDANFAFNRTDPNEIRVAVAGVYEETFTTDDANANALTSVVREFYLTEPAQACIEFEHVTPGDNFGMIIDNVQLKLVPTPGFELEPNDTWIDKTVFTVASLDEFYTGKLEKRLIPDCEPDTYMVLFDKLNNIINGDDNGSTKGNGWASGLFGIDDASGLVNNGDGTRSLRIGVAGRPDGLDGLFNGLFQNNPHGQIGEFTLCITWLDDNGDVCPPEMELPDDRGLISNPQVYVDRFEIGAEAFHLNYVVPEGAAMVDIEIDNTTGERLTCRDVDFIQLDNLVPLCDYCFTQIGGMDCECRPTDTFVGWFDKQGQLIATSYTWDNDTGYDEICFTADAQGRVCLAVTGQGDENFDGFRDAGPRAPGECDLREYGHGVCGCWTFAIRAIAPHGDGSPMGPDDGKPEDWEIMLNAMNHGDINLDGVTDTADLGILIGNFGWIRPQPE